MLSLLPKTLIILLGLAITQMTGCVSFVPSKSVGDLYECGAGGVSDPDQKTRPTKSPVVKVIRLNDQGELVNRCEWTDALYEFKYEKKPNEAFERLKQPVMLLMYVHGWKHNASVEDGDLTKFTQFIQLLAEHEAKRTDKKKRRHVIGIYVGWDGLITDLPVARELTFWGRKQAADQISQSAIVTKLIGAINNIRQQRENPDDFVGFIGHSFGARILFTATSQLLLYNVQTSYPDKAWPHVHEQQYEIIEGPADLIVLLNPAIEASVYTALDSVRRYQEKINDNQHPLLLTISTTNDWATKTAFPLGQWLSRSNHERQLSTLGNYDNYITHTLIFDRKQMIVTANRALSSPWYDDFCYLNICLNRRVEDTRQPRNPFIVATTNEQVLDGHNGIWQDTFIAWLAEFFEEVAKRRAKSGKKQFAQ